MSISMIKEAYLNLYLQNSVSNNNSPSRVICYPLGKVDPEFCDNSKIMQIVYSLLPCLSNTLQLVTVKIFEGYKIIVT